MNVALKPWNIDVAVLIIFFVRDNVLEETFESVRQARPRRLFLWQDGAREGRLDDIEGIERCRKIVENIDWDCEVYKNYQTQNWGCDPSTFFSHRWVFTIVDKCIILEDDCVPSQSFYPFCKELLDKYENDTRISRICGYNNEETTDYCPYDYFFTQGGSVWGWASWKRVADAWDETYTFVNDKYEMKMLEQIIDVDYKLMYEKLMRHVRLGKPFWETINTYQRLLNHQLVIVPTKNLIRNIGATENSTHATGDASVLSKHAYRLLHMPSYELKFPLEHPKYIVSDVSYYNRIARKNPVLGKIVSALKRLASGDFKGIWGAFKRFIKMEESQI